MDDHGWADGMDEDQLAAVDHGDAPLVIMAGAGTGKTRTLTARVARLLDAGVAPERLLLLTFTRRAAAAMTSRAAALCGDPAAGRRMWGGTFHAVAHRLIAEHAHQLGLGDVSVLDAGDVVDLLDLLREEHGLVGTQVRLPTSRALADVYTRAVNTGRPTREVMRDEFPWCLDHVEQINALFGDFVARKRARGLLDFDDLLLTWRALLAHPGVGARLRARWDWVLVDEYQDVNRVQVDIVRLLRSDGAGLTVVGDDAQAIYGFRGASGTHLHEVHAALSGSRLVRLQRNFRSTQQVLDLANVIRPGQGASALRLRADRGQGSARPKLVTCANADAEARAVADAILTAHQDGLPLREQAVLMRTGHHSNQLEIELAVRKIPFVKYGGIEYTDTAHVRDLLAALRLVHNRRDELAWYRLLCRHRAIGKATARSLTAALLATETPADYSEVVAEAPPKARTALHATLTDLADAQAASGPARAVEHCRSAIRRLVRAHYADWPRRIEDLDRLAATAAAQTDLAAFVAELIIDPAAASADYAKKPQVDEDYLTLSTVHSAKGLEWTAVHLIHAVDGAFPSDLALSTDDGLDEEQRLFYVAVTRARDVLSIYIPQRMPTNTGYGARHVLAKPSRFLTDQARAATEEYQPLDRPDQMMSGGAGTRVEIPTLDELFQ
jgi:DNA helicase II / ATP-dependent DNA helicase PcrA